MREILIIDDDPTLCLMLESLLARKNFGTEKAFSAGEALKILKDKKFDLVLSDFRLPDLNGLQLLQRIKSLHSHIPVIIMTSYADIRTAVNAIKAGAYEYIAKPLNSEEVLLLIRSALKNSEAQEAHAGKVQTPARNELQYISGNSPAFLQIDQYIKLVAPTDMSVIVEGESGTGKEIVARRIHMESKRCNKPFVAVDCGVLSSDLAGSELFGHYKGAFTGAIADKEGQFEAARGGTLFLDEITNLSYDIQAKLLRALQERKIRRIGGNEDIDVNVRIIAATNEDLMEGVKQGTFREDLYHRINEFKITVPALRDCSADIELFAQHFREHSNLELGKSVKRFSGEAMEKICAYSWPGNLRELRNIIRRAVLLTSDEEIGIHTMPLEILNNPAINIGQQQSPDLKSVNETNEKRMIMETLEKVNYNKSQAARLLNIDRKTLYNKISRYGINPAG